MAESTTRAGARLKIALRNHAPWFMGGSENIEDEFIAAIESEARQQEREALAERIEGLTPLTEPSDVYDAGFAWCKSQFLAILRALGEGVES